MDAGLAVNSGPDERNPSYEPDRLNDRWPTTQGDRKMLADDMEDLIKALEKARQSEFTDMVAILSDLFGERVSNQTVENFMKRVDQRSGRQTLRFERGTGAIIPATAVAAPAVARAAVEVPRHNFHYEDHRDDLCGASATTNARASSVLKRPRWNGIGRCSPSSS
jgi:hypothetical protein